MALFRHIPQRIRVRDEKGYGIQRYGNTNTYPQEQQYALRRSGIAQACINVLTEFLYGDGFADEVFGETVINKYGQTANDLLRKACRSFATFNGYALVANHNMLGEYTSAYFCPFEFVRIGLEDEELNEVDYYRVWDNWAGESHKQNQSTGEIMTFARFDPGKAAEDLLEERRTLMQVDSYGARGIKREFEYMGQLQYVTESDGGYPASTFDAVVEQVLSTGDQSDFDRSYIRNRYSASRVFVDRSPNISEEVRMQNAAELAKLAGSDDAGKVAMLNGNIEVLDSDIGAVATARNGLKLELIEDITNAFNMPPVLLGRTRQGGFPNQDEMVDAFMYFNSMTRHKRRKIARSFEKLFTNWHFEANPSGDYSITERSFLPVTDEPIAQGNEAIENLRGSVGGVTSLIALQQAVKEGTVSQTGAIEVLRELYGFDAETAIKIVT